MKFTKEKLLAIILEQLEGSEEDVSLEEPESNKTKADVERVLAYIPKIDNIIEYRQLLVALLKHGNEIPQKQRLLLKLHQILPKFIKGIQK